MKRILIVAAVFAFILILTKLASDAGADQPTGISFSLKAQKVVTCNDREIVLADAHDKSTRLDRGDNWPDCSAFKANEFQDFYLSRGAKTRFEKTEQTAWWRKAM